MTKLKLYEEYKVGDFLVKSQLLLLKIAKDNEFITFTWLDLKGNILAGIVNPKKRKKFEIVENV